MTRDMQDKLEHFVEENKERFDTFTPKDSIWEGVKSELDSSKQHSKMILWRAAAIIMFAISIGLTFYANRDSILKAKDVLSKNSDFVTTEKYYASIINEKKDFIKTVASSYPDVETDFESDWAILDKSYTQLKKEYNENQSEEVLNALIQNLQARVNLLNTQVKVLSTMKSEDNNQLQI